METGAAGMDLDLNLLQFTPCGQQTDRAYCMPWSHTLYHICVISAIAEQHHCKLNRFQ